MFVAVRALDRRQDSSEHDTPRFFSRMRFLLASLLFVAYVCSTKGHGKDHDRHCRYWCKTSDHRYYCCPTGKHEGWMEHVWRFFLHPWLWISVGEFPLSHSSWPEIVVTEIETEKKAKKYCPPLRAHCPRTYDWYSPPSLCHRDDDCDEWEKCCLDVCLGHKTCKSAE
ncbi:uncharacterized protein LOC128880144 [Hylaeus volcanicus]|uniref:uncharacterized protein LOC128880144 n=1 Tax=Hylaeus volcanicus TaxID=313075 RepID=UPI0023B7E60B|nr:uncharacterized protein LOC128880144 [Hylaeus volcanicus]